MYVYIYNATVRKRGVVNKECIAASLILYSTFLYTLLPTCYNSYEICKLLFILSLQCINLYNLKTSDNTHQEKSSCNVKLKYMSVCLVVILIVWYVMSRCSIVTNGIGMCLKL